ncbi:peptidoglycan recognition protein [Streptomyces sp. NPDC101166]|uniref:peptidoglycan recognition protein family protein n=1 Tax=Streptomyces sp. NPDC101166 TaxID=3366120 RepID=UPI003810E0AE
MRRRWWGTGAVVAAGVCGTLLAVQTVTGEPSGAGGRDDRGPVRDVVRSAALTPSPGGGSATLGRRRTEPFSMLGVTWRDPSALLAGTVEVRTRAVGPGTWSDWLTLERDAGREESGGVRGGTEPAWVGPSDGVEVRVNGKAARRLPQGLRLDMIAAGGGATAGGGIEPAAFVADGSGPTAPESTPSEATPSTPPPASETATDEPSASEPPASESVSPSVSSSVSQSASQSASPSASASAGASPSASASPSPSGPGTPPAPPSTVPRPPITPRSGWDADESLSPEEPAYLPDGKIKAVVVHHTAQSNDYTCAEAPSIINAVYTYDVRTLGWKDLGYNFVVDRCGTVYEGRKGGVDLPVVGAHAYGFNSQTTGIAVLGTYTDSPPSQAAMVSVARLAAWKLGQYGVEPDSTVDLNTAVEGRTLAGKSWGPGETLTLPAIHGHRDGYNTLCPGDAFYARLGELRGLAAGPVTGLTLTSVTGTTTVGPTRYATGPVTLNWAAATPAALVSRYEVLVDGEPAVTADGAETSARVPLTDGAHQLRVRAVHLSGRTSVTEPVAVTSDTTAPTFPVAPGLALRQGVVDGAAVPLTLRWNAADAALKEVRLTAPTAAAYGPAVTSAPYSAPLGATTTWSLNASDVAGNTATASVAGTPEVLQETDAVRTGTWTALSSGGFLGGGSLGSRSKGASLTWDFTGRSVAWVVARSALSGRADVYVDGEKATTVDLRLSTVGYRNAIWTRTWSASAPHTVRIVVEGTPRRPTVLTDGIVYLK